MLSENGQDQPLDHRFGCPKVPVAVHTSRLSSREVGKSSGKSPFTPVRESSGEPLSNRHVDDCLAKGGPAIENRDEENTVACQCCMICVSFLAAPAKAQGVPQAVEITKVDVQKVAAGYRASKVIGCSVINEANETIGEIDDLLVTRDGRSHTPFCRLAVSWAWAPAWWSSVTTASSSPTTRLCCRAGQRTDSRCCRRSNTLRNDCPRCSWLLATV